jgi:serine/threonine-protein kinase
MPPPVVKLLHRCLEKERRQRLADISDARLEIDDGLAQAGNDAMAPASAVDVTRPRSRITRWPSFAVALVGASALAVVATAAWLTRPGLIRTPTAIRRFAVTLAPAQLDISHAGHDVAITPDGSKLVYFARRGTGRQLYIRALDAVEGTALLDAEQYGAPFVSPDGAWIGLIDMFTAAVLKIPAAGGPPVSIAPRAFDHLAFAGAAWGSDDSIVIARGMRGLWRVAAAGGTPVQLTAPDQSRGELSHAWPEFLPGAKAVLFTSATRDGLQVRSLNLETLEQKVLVRGASGAKYSSTGHLLYGVSEGTGLRAVPFDPVRIEVLGAPITVVPDVMGKLGGVVNFSVAADGTVAYIPGKRLLTMGFGPVDPLRSGNTGDLDAALMWFDRFGNPGAQLHLTEHCRNPTLSPDERHVAVECYDTARKRDVWTVDLDRGTSERMTFEPTGEADPVWSPDGRQLLFSSVTDGPKAKTLILRKALSSGEIGYEKIFEADTVLYTQHISADGATLLLVQSPSIDIVMLSLEDRGPLKPVVQTRSAEIEPQFSPDGRYVSYASNESGRFEVYVQPWPVTGQKWKVSLDGGTDATWRKDGRELFYLRPDKMLMAVPVELSPTLRLGTPTSLFRAPIAGPLGGGQRFPYAATRDGQRFLIYAESSAAAPQSINVVVNWTSNLQR